LPYLRAALPIRQAQGERLEACLEHILRELMNEKFTPSAHTECFFARKNVSRRDSSPWV